MALFSGTDQQLVVFFFVVLVSLCSFPEDQRDHNKEQHPHGDGDQHGDDNDPVNAPRARPILVALPKPSITVWTCHTLPVSIVKLCSDVRVLC